MSLLNRAHAITRHIYQNQLFDWIMAITKAIAGSPALIGVGPYETVARASSTRMLDEDAGLLAGIENGAAVWTESLKSVWYWRTDFPAATATDNETTCRPTAWIATALPGAFVRDLSGDPRSRTQAPWFVDSTAADNEGDGLTALTPLKNDVEIARRWGPGPVPLTVPVVVTYAQTPTTQTNYDVQYIGGSLKLVGVKTTVLGGVVLSAVTAQNRATQTPWDITGPGLGVAHVGLLVQITASATPANVGAYAVVAKEIVPGQVRVSPFGTSVVSSTQFTVVTPAIGDTVEVISFPELSIGAVQIRNGTIAAFAASPLANCTVIDLLTLKGSPDNAVLDGIVFSEASRVFYQRVLINRMRFGGSGGPGSGALHLFCGVGWLLGSNGLLAGAPCTIDAGCVLPAVGMTVFSGAQVTARKDLLFQGSTWTMLASCRLVSQGVAYFDAVIGITVPPDALYLQNATAADWGTNNSAQGIYCNSLGRYCYVNKPTINSGLGAGRETNVGGTDKLYAAIPYIEGANGAGIVLFA